MFKRCIIYYPSDENGRKYLAKELASFRVAETVRYICSLDLSDRQTETLFAELTEHHAKLY